MTRCLGIATIGQAPRDDLVRHFAAHVPPGTRIVLRGCLDGLSDAEIEARPPETGDDALYTPLRGGRDIRISKRHVVEHAPSALARLREDGADVIVFACTGEFPPMRGDGGVIFPSRILNGIGDALLSSGRLGLLVPLAEQIPKLTAKWARPGLEVAAVTLVPSSDGEAVRRAAASLAATKPDLVAMDCMSYTPAMKTIVRDVVRVPVLLGVTATAHVIHELLA